MKIDNLIKMISILPKSKNEAKTSEQISKTYFLSHSIDDPEKQGTKNTFIRRQIDGLIELKMIGTVFGGKALQDVKRYNKYYLIESSLAKYFMNSKVALSVIWSNNIMKLLGPVMGADDMYSAARAVRMNQGEKILAGKIRMVPDGIARDYADIKPDVLKPFLEALQLNHSLMLRFHDRQNNVTDETQSRIARTVLGLVAKDGTIYTITCKGFDDIPMHIPMHRIEKVIETGARAYARPDFELDDYIASQHQLAHILREQESPIKMVLKVNEEAIFHFRERPISGNQEISKKKDKDGRFTVTVTVPFTIQLPPFIWSHAGWVEVISPPALRKYVGERLLAAAEYYRKDVKPAKAKS